MITFYTIALIHDLTFSVCMFLIVFTLALAMSVLLLQIMTHPGFGHTLPQTINLSGTRQLTITGDILDNTSFTVCVINNTLIVLKL